MEAQRTIISRRIVTINASLSEEEVKELLARAVIAQHGGTQANMMSASLREGTQFNSEAEGATYVVRLSDRTGEAEIVIRFQTDVEIAP